MPTLTFNSNISALLAQRRLSDGANALQQSFERLSSGLRINRASDDAAGLSIASTLSAQSRIFTQGVRNANDGISLLNVAEGAGTQLNGILERLKELAESAANGTLTLTQRKSLDTEAYELQKEFNRITQTTSFNNRALFDGTFGRLNIQGGTGAGGTIGFNLGSGLATNASTGTFSSAAFSAMGGNTIAGFMDSGDFNGDGLMDIVSSYSVDLGAMVMLSNGDGTFASSHILGTSGADNVVVRDLNKDGKLDILTAGIVSLGKGNGTFSTGQSLGSSDMFFQLADINGDGNDDYIGTGSGNVNIRLGNGNGTFGASSVVVASSSATQLSVSDLNGDGKLDIATADGAVVRTYLGGGTGSFVASGVITNSSTMIRSADLNHDGLADLYVESGGIYLSNGNGTFRTMASATAFEDAKLADLNGDGIVDLLVADSGNSIVRFGNGDGTFKSSTSQTITPFMSGAAFGDFNGDGVLDIASGSQVAGGVWATLSNTTSITSIARLDLLSASNARSALTDIERMSQRVSTELSAIGVSQSRLQAMSNVLESGALNFTSARSRIVDADMAQESASLVSRQIRQQAAAAVLSQANQLPALALSLLQF